MTTYIPSKQSLAEPREQEMLGCSFRHWHRLKSRVTELGNPHGSHETWATFCFGIAASGVFSFVVESASDNPQGWMRVVYLVVAAAFTLAGLVIHSLTKDTNKRRVQDAADIVNEMDLIEESWISSTEKGGASE